MIDVKELSIGDWLRCNDLEIQVAAIGETVGFLDCNNKVYWAYEGLDRVDYIPLTEEILVKNGFKHQMPYDDYVLGELCLYEGGDGYIVNGFVGLGNLIVHCDYVHQLQHLLRLCGIETEITI